MWKLILLFVVLTPGILFTVPRIGKTKLLAVCVHALIFVVLSQWLQISEGFSSAIVIPLPPPPKMTRGMSQKEYDMQMQVWETNRKYIQMQNALNAKLAADAQKALNAQNAAAAGLCSPGTYVSNPSTIGSVLGFRPSCEPCPIGAYCPGKKSGYMYTTKSAYELSNFPYGTSVSCAGQKGILLSVDNDMASIESGNSGLTTKMPLSTCSTIPSFKIGSPITCTEPFYKTNVTGTVLSESNNVINIKFNNREDGPFYITGMPAAWCERVSSPESVSSPGSVPSPGMILSRAPVLPVYK